MTYQVSGYKGDDTYTIRQAGNTDGYYLEGDQVCFLYQRGKSIEKIYGKITKIKRKYCNLYDYCTVETTTQKIIKVMCIDMLNCHRKLAIDENKRYVTIANLKYDLMKLSLFPRADFLYDHVNSWLNQDKQWYYVKKMNALRSRLGKTDSIYPKNLASWGFSDYLKFSRNN